MLRVDSREVLPGDTFLALKGEERDGHDYIEHAIDMGATCVIAQEGNYDVKTILTKDTRVYLAKYLKELYADKLKKIELIGIAGARGKTTTAYLVYNLLNNCGKKCAYVGSKGFWVNNKIKDLNNITPDLYQFYELILEAVNNDCEYLVLEITNYALKQNRLDGLKFKFLAITNSNIFKKENILINDYIDVQTKIIDKIKGSGYILINCDDDYADKFINEKKRNILFGKKDCDYQLSCIKSFETYSVFKLKMLDIKLEIKLPLPCAYNIYNYLIAFIILDKVGIKIEKILSETSCLKMPEGIYHIFENENKKVIVDNASIPGEVKDVVNYARKYTEGKIISIIGIKGKVDEKTRKMLAKTITKVSDFVIFTTDNSYKESSDVLINDAISELSQENYEIILDRKLAIKKGINLISKGDTLMILGRGDEEYQIIDNEKFNFSDINEVSKQIKK